MGGKRCRWMRVGFAMFLGAAAWCAAEGPKAPHGGRLMSTGKTRVEFRLDQDRKARLYLYDTGLKPLAAAPRTFTLWVVQKTGAKKVALVKDASGVVSASALPSPGGYPVVLAVQGGAKPVKFRFKLLEEECGGCKLPEYACTCGH